MAQDFMPRKDADFHSWSKVLVKGIADDPALYGLTAADAAELQAEQAQWDGGYSQHIEAHARAKASRTNKDQKRRSFDKCIREKVRRAQANPGVSEDVKIAIGLPRRDDIRTPAPAPQTQPALQVSFSERFEHRLLIRDEGGAHRAKPKGVRHAEIWVKTGGSPPLDLAECRFLDATSRPEYIARYEGSLAGQTAHYIARWVSHRGEKGPLSAVHSATIPG